VLITKIRQVITRYLASYHWFQNTSFNNANVHSGGTGFESQFVLLPLLKGDLGASSPSLQATDWMVQWQKPRLPPFETVTLLYIYSAFGKSLYTYIRCWKWCPRASIQDWTRLILFTNTFCRSAFGKSLCTYKRCWKWCPRASIQAWTRLMLFANTFCRSAFGKSLCTYKRCWKWCQRASIQVWTRLMLLANTFCRSAFGKSLYT
jgi:hypothetical protein